MKKKIEFESIPEIGDLSNQIPIDSEIFIAKSMAISKRIFQLMSENKWIQKELAEKLEKSEAEISKLLSGGHNYTLRTLAKIEAVLGKDIVSVPEYKETKTWVAANIAANENTDRVAPNKEQTQVNSNEVGNTQYAMAA